jgi:hypothetical protein
LTKGMFNTREGRSCSVFTLEGVARFHGDAGAGPDLVADAPRRRPGGTTWPLSSALSTSWWLTSMRWRSRRRGRLTARLRGRHAGREL